MDIKMQNLRNLKTTMRQVKFPVEYVAVQSCAQIVSKQTWNKQQHQSNTEEAWWVEKVIRRYVEIYGTHLQRQIDPQKRNSRACYVKYALHAEAEANNGK